MHSSRLIIFSLLFLFSAGFLLTGHYKKETSKHSDVLSPSSTADQTLYPVTRVVDGDTLKVYMNGSVQTIRLIGIDAPESVDPRKPVECFGKEASAKMTSLVAGKQVRLANDPSQGDSDMYHRLLRYVFLPDDTMINELLIKQGYAFEYTYQIPYKYQTEFKADQTEASRNGYGLWNSKTCNGS